MRDLTSLKDGIPNKFENGHINFEVCNLNRYSRYFNLKLFKFQKFWKIAKYTSELLNLKSFNVCDIFFCSFLAYLKKIFQHQCPYQERSKVINYMLTTPLLTDDGCELASYECEPPESDTEKRHRDKLRYVMF